MVSERIRTLPGLRDTKARLHLRITQNTFLGVEHEQKTIIV